MGKMNPDMIIFFRMRNLAKIVVEAFPEELGNDRSTYSDETAVDVTYPSPQPLIVGTIKNEPANLI
jgi:hypothetical protein